MVQARGTYIQQANIRKKRDFKRSICKVVALILSALPNAHEVIIVMMLDL